MNTNRRFYIYETDIRYEMQLLVRLQSRVLDSVEVHKEYILEINYNFCYILNLRITM